MVFDHTSPSYSKKWKEMGPNRYNGAYYYSQEIKDIMIPRIETDRNWVLINVPGECYDHSVVFIHNNQYPSRYEWLGEYNDLILICGVPSTCEKVAHLGKAFYLPLSVNVAEVAQYKCEKDRGIAFVGRKSKRRKNVFHSTVDILEGMPREKLLAEMAHYRKIYAVGRTAIEGRILGCEILRYDKRFPDPSIWEVRDSLEVVPKLHAIIDSVDL